jgi:hypothetical protein
MSYVAATRRFDDALRSFSAANVPLDPGRRANPIPWTRTHVAVMREFLAALAEVIEKRRDWDGMRREWRPPH